MDFHGSIIRTINHSDGVMVSRKL